MSRAPNGLAHLLNRDDDANHTSSRERVSLEVRNCLLDTLRENDRYYQVYPGGICLYPCDSAEHDRQDMLQHGLHGILLRQHNPKLAAHKVQDEAEDRFRADVIAPCRRQGRALDVGCGTGLWALDVAERYPHMLVEGIDLVGAQPDPRQNNKWRTSKAGHGQAVDFNKPFWHDIEPSTYELLHASHLCGSVTSWDDFIANSSRSLAPGGWFESIEIDWQPCCDDGTLSHNSVLHTWWHHISRATATRPLQYPAHLPQLLRRSGFVNVQGITFPIPTNKWAHALGQQATRWIQTIMTQPVLDREQLQLPQANWATRVKELGEWMNSMFTNTPALSPSETFNGLSMAPLTRNLHWQKGQVDALVHDLTACSANVDCHAYFRLHIVIAQKPAQ